MDFETTTKSNMESSRFIGTGDVQTPNDSKKGEKVQLPNVVNQILESEVSDKDELTQEHKFSRCCDFE